MNNNIQCSIESSTTKIELNSAVEGVFLVPELEGLAGLPEIRTTSGVNAGYDGGWTSAQNYDARLISIRGVIANPDVSKVEAKRRAIASLLGQGRKERLTLRFTTEAGNSYVIYVRTISCEMALQRVLTTQEFLIQLRADDPLIYDDGASSGTEAILQVQKALGGFEINFELPLAIGGGAEDTIVENGSETIYPIINLYGPLHSPTVVNRTTNQQMQILADLQYSISWSGYQTKDIGAYGQLDNELDGAPMYLSQLTGNAEQTTYSGKNLFNWDRTAGVPSNTGWANTTPRTFNFDEYVLGIARNNYYNGASTITSHSVANGVIKVTTNQAYYGLGFPVKVLPSTTYTLSKTGDASVYFGFYVSDGTYISDTTSSTFTTPSNCDFVVVVITSDTAGVEKTASNIQLELGSTATSYEPYVGGTASPNPDYPQPISTVTGEQVVKIEGSDDSQEFEVNLGKNLLNFEGFLTAAGATYTLEGNTYSVTNMANMYSSPYPLDLKEGKTYTLSQAYQTQDSTNVRLEILKNGAIYTACYADQPENRVKTFTADGSAYSIRANYSTRVYPVLFNSPMIAEAPSETAYAPYFTPIELAKIGTYQDRIYKDDGKWYIEKQIGKVVYNGSESWGPQGGTGYIRVYLLSQSDALVPPANVIGIMSDNYTGILASELRYEQKDYGIALSNSAGRVFIRDKDQASASDLKAWLSTHPTTVYYALATPTTTEITDETLLAQLNFIASLYEGVNNISIVGTGAQGQIVVKYATVKTINQDVAVIDSQARTITLNGQDIYHLKSEESEFLLLAPGDNKLYLTSEVSDDSGYAEVKFKQGYLSI